jgi:hypothetical protein
VTEINPLTPGYRIDPGKPVSDVRKIRRPPAGRQEDSRRKPGNKPDGERDRDTDTDHVDEYA